MKNIKKYFSVFVYYPLWVVIILGWFLIPYFKPYLKEIIGFGIVTTILFGMYLLIPRVKIQKWFLAISIFLLAVLAFIKLSFYYHYNVKLSASALFVIFETNTQESREFLSYYLDTPVVFLAMLLFLPWVISLPFILKEESRFLFADSLKSKKWKWSIVLGIVISVFVIHKKFSEHNIIYTSIASYSDYQITKAVLKKTLAKSKSDIVTVTSSDEKPQTHVVIIGESTSRWHMQLYGYERETNPLLTEIKDELVIFKDVITPNVHTILALDKILTFSDYTHPNKEENASIVQLANQAGFTTYWISNQRPVGFHESVSTLIGNASDQTYFLATDNYNNPIYDEVILPKLEEVLTQEDKKKMIFIHLIGTHGDYKKRYPEKYDYFNDSPPQTPFITKSNEHYVNEYDNAIRYNDFIVRSIIETIRNEAKSSYVVYFSDHGDELHDTMDLRGHNEYYGTAPMYEVPFLIWTSPEYKKQHPDLSRLNSVIDRKYNLEDFIHSFSDLSRIESNLMDKSRSIFNEEFQERIRWIKKNEDYDRR